MAIVTAKTLVAFAGSMLGIVLLLPILLIAILIRLTAMAIHGIARLVEPRFVPWRELMRYDPKLGWRPIPNVDARYFANWDDIYRIVTDAEGWTGQTALAESQVVVIGDSFASGYGIDPKHAYFAVTNGVSVKAIGAPGYSMVHGLRLIEELGDRLRGKLVVWMVYVENDLKDNLEPHANRYRVPFLRKPPLGDWEIHDAHVSPEPWNCSGVLSHHAMLSAFCTPGPIAERAYSACKWLVSKASDRCRHFGAELAVIAVPHRVQLSEAGLSRLVALSPNHDAFDPDMPDREFRALCASLSVPFVAGRAEFMFADYKRREGIHWNRRGHRRMARILEQLQAAHETRMRGGPAHEPVIANDMLEAMRTATTGTQAPGTETSGAGVR
jgi:hypothetical protein